MAKIDAMVAEIQAKWPALPLVWKGCTLNLAPAEGDVAEATRMNTQMKVGAVNGVGNVPTVSAATPGKSAAGSGRLRV